MTDWLSIGLGVGGAAGLVLGFAAGLLAGAARRARLAVELEHAGRAAGERAAAWEEERRRLEGAFAELSGQALERNAERFLTLADERFRRSQELAASDLAQRQQAIGLLLQPLQETLGRYEQGLRRLEHDRVGAYEALTAQVAQMGQTQEQLRRETRQLVTALRSPQVRGRWGEVQLRRVVEMAGMVRHCDFDEQVGTDVDGGRLRPDMVVHVPGGGRIVVDAKVPLDAYLRAIETEDDLERQAQFAAHARQVRAHVDQMVKREYWRHVGGSAEQVVVFVPGDPLLAAAYERDPMLQEHAMANGVLLTTPTMLIALLRTVAYGWRHEALADNARQVQQLGTELYDRLRRFGGHLARLQRSLSGTVDAFNQAVGSLESRVLVTARKLPELGAGLAAEELGAPGLVETMPRRLQAGDLDGTGTAATGARAVPSPAAEGALGEAAAEEEGWGTASGRGAAP